MSNFSPNSTVGPVKNITKNSTTGAAGSKVAAWWVWDDWLSARVDALY